MAKRHHHVRFGKSINDIHMGKVVDFDHAQQLVKKRSVVGSRVLMQDSHPHAGKSGTIVSIDKTILGERPRVHLDDGMECFIMKQGDAWITLRS